MKITTFRRRRVSVLFRNVADVAKKNVKIVTHRNFFKCNLKKEIVDLVKTAPLESLL